MNKREFIKGLGLAIGASAATHFAGAGNAITVARAYSPRADSLESDGKLLTRAELHTLHDICRQVLPTTDTPGAHEMDVHGFIDNQLVNCHGEQDQLKVQNTLAILNRQAQKANQLEFADISEPQQLELLTRLENGATPFNGSQSSDFGFLKRMIVFGYYTSEAGCTRELRFLPYPGGFKGSIPWAEDDRAWY